MHDIFYYNYLDSRDIKEILPKVSSARTEYAWLVLNSVDTTNFDFHFVPNKYEQDQVHAWPVGSNPNHYGIYLVPVDVRLMGMTYDFNYHKQAYPLKDPVASGWRWHYNRVIDVSDIDYQWLPDSWDTGYSRHQFSMAGTEQLSYVELIHQGLGNSVYDIKYHKSDFKFKKPVPRVTNVNEMPYDHSWVWVIDKNVDYTDFDFNWLPDRWDSDKEHGFAMAGTDQLCYTWLYNLDIHMGKSVKYHSTDLKFKEVKKIYNWNDIVWGKDEFVWVLDNRVDYTGFDFTWLPDYWDKQIKHGFCMQGTDQLAYTFLVNTKQLPTKNKWYETDLKFKKIKKVYAWEDVVWGADEFVWVLDSRIDYSDFDFNWMPDGWDKNIKHCFAMKNTDQLGYTFLINTQQEPIKSKWHATDLTFKETKKYYSWDEVQWGTDEFVWVIDSRIDYDDFDFTWLPNEWDKNLKHGFCNAGTDQLAYTFLVNTLKEPAKTKWHKSDLTFNNVKKVYSWDDISWGKDEFVWVVDSRIDYRGFDFTWLPQGWDKAVKHCFAMKNTTQLGYTYLVNTLTEPTKDKWHNTNLTFKEAKKVYSWEDITWGTDEFVWVVDHKVNYDDFDFTWLPDGWDKAVKHCFAMKNTDQLGYTFLVNTLVEPAKDKWHKSGLTFNNIKKVYSWDELTWGEDQFVWVLDFRIDYSNFDFTWLPNRWDKSVKHGFEMQNAEQLAYTYLVNTEQEPSKTKWHPSSLVFNNIKKVYSWDDLEWGIDEFVWVLDSRVDYRGFDFNWLPEGWDKTVKHSFCMRGADQLAYTVLVNTAEQPKKNKWHKSDLVFSDIKKVYNWSDISWGKDDFVWVIDSRIDYRNFDFTWLPPAWDKNKLNAFCMHNAEQLAYTFLVNTKEATQSTKWHDSDLKFSSIQTVYDYNDIEWGRDDFVWVINKDVNYDGFDFHWLPTGWDKNIRHAFAMQGTTQLAETFLINTEKQPAKTKYYSSNLQYTKIKKYFKPLDKIEFSPNDVFVWSCDNRIDYSEFDFDWLPDAWDIKKIHAFAMKDTEQLAYTFIKHRDCAADAEIKYHVSELKFKELTLLDKDLDQVLAEYAGKDQFVWLKDARIDYTDFNFAWLPDSWDKNKLHYFAMNGTEQLAYTAVVNPMYYDKTQEPVYHLSNLEFAEQHVKVWNSELKVSLSQKILQDSPSEEWTWYTDSRINYNGFDFNWLPDAWDKRKVHAFCMKNAEQLSYTWLVHKDCDLNNLKFKYHTSDLEFNDGVVPVVFWPKFTSMHLESDNWQDNLRIVASKLAFGSEWIWICDERIDYASFDFDWLPAAWDSDFIHCFTLKGRERLSYTWLVRADNLHKDARYKYHETDLMLQNHYDVIELDMLMDGTKSQYKQQRFLSTMEEALKTAARKTDQEWLWVLSNCCDYTDFNLDYLPELDGVEYTHCWPSGTQQKGETFLIHVPTYLQTNKFKFNFDHKEVQRKPWPVIEYTNDNLAEAIRQNPSRSIYTLYKHKDTDVLGTPMICLWEKRAVVALNRSQSDCLVPRDCVVKKEIYEYPYLHKASHHATEPKIDVIFISNGESQAERNWQQCKKVFGHAQRVDGVNGRLASYQAAANLSSTDWFIAVFAKCKILDVYDNIGFGWQPDYWQQSKHYIFLNKNLETELIYGHMAPIAYNKKLMLENQGGLDMTLTQQHVVVPITISETDLSDDPWLAWRTAFREVVKLNYYANGELSVEGEYRLWSWQTKGSEWSQRGAIDAMNYIREHGLTEEAVMPTVEWAWLEQYFKKIYNADITEVITRSTALSDK